METTNWDYFWAEGDEEEKEFWEKPDPAVLEIIDRCPPKSYSRVLDLGCGIGRHSLVFAREGYEVTAVDSSKMAISHVQERARLSGLKVETIYGDYKTPLFQEGSFDIVVCYNVVYHGLREEMVRAINLCQQYLKPGGILFLTCPTRDDGKYGDGEKIAPHTFCGNNSIHPGDVHYFSSSEDLDSFISGFEVLDQKKRENYWKKDGIINFSSYWQVLAKKI